jgi:peptidoglycan/LPS O-acetylase OafA/YrhL
MIAHDQTEIKALTGARGMAAILVFLGHFHDSIARFVDISVISHFLSKVGYWVDFFFVLSGFILAYVYSGMYAKYEWKFATREFAISRFARIWPLHILILTILLLFGLVKYGLVNYFGIGANSNPFYEWTAIGFVVNIFLLQVISETFTWNPPAWSISVEMFAYACFPFLFYRQCSRVCYLTGGAATLIGLHIIDRYENLNIFPWVVLRGVGEFLIGFVLFQYSAWVNRFASNYLTYFQIGALALAVALIESNAPQVAIVSSFSALIYLLASDKGFLAYVLGNGPMLFFGKISFSIYLSHWAVILFFSSVFSLLSKMYPGLTHRLQLAEAIAVPIVVVLFSTATYLTLETRLRKKLVTLLSVP